jgi:hypothetical protein
VCEKTGAVIKPAKEAASSKFLVNKGRVKYGISKVITEESNTKPAGEFMGEPGAFIVMLHFEI